MVKFFSELLCLVMFAVFLCGSSVRAVPVCFPGELDPVTFEQCGNRGYAMSCNSSGLKNVPDSYPAANSTFIAPLCLLDLSNNSITTLWNQSFLSKRNLNASDLLWLYLQNNSLSFIAADAFEGLHNLLYLNLTHNYLEVKSIEHSAFRHLTLLKNINLKVNNFTTFDGLDKEIMYLKVLEGLFINALTKDCKFGVNFRTLSSLILISLSGMAEGSCYMDVVNNDTFSNVPQINRLFMNNCHIKRFEANALSHFSNLTDLDLSYNENLTFDGMNTALHGLINSYTLKVLNVNKIHTVYELGIMLKLEDVENLSTLRVLQTLYMDLNKIEVFDERILSPTFMFPTSLRKFTLAGNRLTYGKYTNYINLAKNITYLDISRQHLNYDPFYPHELAQERSGMQMTNNLFNINADRYFSSESSYSLRDNEKGSNCIHLPENIKKLKWRKSFLKFEIPDSDVCGGKNLDHLDLSFNLLTKWIGPISGLPNLKYLDLSENYCQEVSSSFFKEFPKLEHLNISGNAQIGQSFNPNCNSSAETIFANLSNLTILDISSCGIHGLPKEIFKNMTRLEKLNVSNNDLHDWNVNLSNCMCLKHIDLSENLIDTLKEDFTLYLDSLVRSPCNAGKNITLKLGGNPFDCSCKSIPFFKWALDTEVIVNFKKTDMCNLNGERKHLEHVYDYERLVNILENDPVCKSQSWITILIGVGSAVLGGIVSALAGTLVYRKRWKLRYWYYNKNRRFIHEGYEHLFATDAVISYSKDKASFIKNNLVPALEGMHGLSLWVADRNSQPGVSVAENITHAIYNSRKTVLLIDREYLKDSWCNYDMNMALVEAVESKRQLIVAVLMEKQLIDSLPIIVMRFLQSERSLEFPEFGEDMNTFWTNLACEIRS